MFIGDGRERIVADMLHDFAAVSVDGPPRCTIIWGPPGSGKTRIVQELFRQLPRGRGGGGYWPAHLVDEGPWETCRKSLQPEGDRNAGRPPWVWWAIECHEHYGTLQQSLFNDETRLQRQLEHLSRGRALRIIREGLTWLDYFLTATSLLLVLVSQIGLGARLSGSALAWIDALLLVSGTSAFAWTTFRRRYLIRKAWRALRPGSAAEWQDGERYGRRSAVERLADRVVATSRTVPVVIIIDDAHSGDETLVSFLTQVLDRPRARVLVVACSWPTTEGSALPFDEWRSAAISRGEGRITGIDLLTEAPLTRSDLATLLRDEVVRQGIDPDSIDAATYSILAAKAEGNPLAAIVQLQADHAAELLASGSLDPVTAAVLPAGLRAIIQSYWRAIPEPVRAALALGALVGRDFPESAVVQSLDRTGRGPGAELLRRANDTFRVIRMRATNLRRFVDHLYLREARSDADDAQMVPERALAALAEEIGRSARAETLVDMDPEVREVLLAAHVQLALDGHVHDRLGATRSAIELGEQFADRSGYMSALQHAQHAEELDPLSDHGLTLRHRSARVRWHLAAGQSTMALRRAEDLALIVQGSNGERSVARVRVDLLLGEVRIAAGQHHEALAPLEDVLEVARFLEDCPGSVLNRVETQVAECNSRSGRFVVAAEILEAQAERLAVNPTSAPQDLVGAQLSALKIRLRSGHRPDAVGELRMAVGRSDSLLGMDSPQSLRGRLLLVEALMTYEDESAIHEAERVVEHALAVRHPRHLDVIRAQIRRCEAIRAVGTTDDLLHDAADVHRIAEQELGTSNPNTVRALGIWVDALIRSATEREEPASAIIWDETEQKCRLLLRLCAGAFGPGNADTLMAERRLLLILDRTGRTEEALPLAEDLLERTARIRGDEHPDTLRTRGIRLELRRRSNADDGDSLTLEQSNLVADCRRILGDGHPLCPTLGSRA